ncbi:hypothetical protein [Ruegeria jejuensis]|uniref:hypothetical protein n=1 Tax=Ruegeria jejuensis TaxID=3233338 RepID=UPI00355B874C
MSRRTQRGFVNKAEALEMLATGRSGVIKVSTQAKIKSPEYKAAQNVLSAIDVLAEKLTGDPEHFHLKAATHRTPSD